LIAAWLGHADPAFTVRTYAHPHAGALKIAAESLQQFVSNTRSSL
jgi:integrase